MEKRKTDYTQFWSYIGEGLGIIFIALAIVIIGYGCSHKLHHLGIGSGPHTIEMEKK